MLARLLNQTYEGNEGKFTNSDWQTITFVNNHIYRHKVLRINYTTYDVHCAQDSLNPRTHTDVMVLSHEDKDEDPHPYWYTQIIGVFHAQVWHMGPRSKSTDVQWMDFLWVWWFGHDLNYQAGWNAKRLYRLGFLHPEDSGGAFGFLDPNEVICRIHLIPTFAYGRTSDILTPSIARQPHENNEDWVFYYVNMCMKVNHVLIDYS